MRRRFARPLLPVLGLLVCLAPHVASAQDTGWTHPMLAHGQQPNHGTYSALPFESIDMVTGNVVLTFNGLTLPGPEDIAIDIRAILNLGGDGTAWHVFQNGPVVVGLNQGGAQMTNPVIAMSDGSQQATFATNEGTPGVTQVFRTLSYSRVTIGWQNSTYARVERPNGVVWYFEATTPGDTVLPIRSVTDPFGNALTYEYEVHEGVAGLASITQHLRTAEGGEQVRMAYFTMPAAGQQRVTAEGRSWDYYHSESLPLLLSEIRPPTGPSWTFAYGPPEYNRYKTTVTLPTGGWVRYETQYQPGPARPDQPHAPAYSANRLTDRYTSDAWHWQFTYDDYIGDGPFYSAVEIIRAPNVLLKRHAYSHFRWQHDANDVQWRTTRVATTSESVGEVDEGGFHEKERRVYAWIDNGEPVGEAICYFCGTDDQYFDTPIPLLWGGKTVTREGQVFATTYHHCHAGTDPADLQRLCQNDLPNDAGQPFKVTETGTIDGTWDTTYAYWNSVSSGHPYILGRVSSATLTANGESYTSSFDYHDNGFMWRKKVLDQLTTYTPDAGGRVASEIDADGHETSYTYAWGVLANTQTPEFLIERSINSDGTVAWENRQGHRVAAYEWDALGRQTRRTPAVGAATTTTYDMDGGVSRHTERQAWTLDETVDGFGRISQSEEGAGNAAAVIVRREFDALGRKTRETLPHHTGDPEQLITYSYDVLDRVAKKTNPDGTDVQYTYTGLDVSIKDENGHIVDQVWRAVGSPQQARLEAVTERSGEGDAAQTTTYTYDALDTLVGVAHPNLTSRTWAYAPGTHRLVSETQPESGTTTYDDYSAAGLLKQKTEADGQVTEYRYDGADRLTDIRPTGKPATHVGYDAWGNRQTLSNGAVTTTFNYSPDGVRLHSRTDAVTDGGTFVTTFDRFDDRDNVTKMTYPSGKRVGFDYDVGNRVVTVCVPNTTGAGDGDGCSSPVLLYASGITYDASGGLGTLPHANGVVDAISYDPLTGRPDTLAIGAALHLHYDYDRVGNVTQISESTRPGQAASTLQTFGYDQVDRLRDAAGGWGSVHYDLDSVGNRTHERRNAVTTDYTVTPDNFLRAVAIGGQVQDAFTPSPVGHVLEDARAAYTYTASHMLATYTTKAAPSVQYTFTYDGEDQRIRRSEGSLRSTYTVHGPGDVVLSEFEETGGVRQWTKDYLYVGTRLLATVRPVAPGDFNGDNKPDIVWHSTTSNASVVWYMDGVLKLGYDAVTPAIAGRHVATADFDGDGHLDLVWRDRASGANTMWFMNGATRRAEATLPPVTDAAWRIVGAGDFNGDGHPDLVWQDVTTGQNVVWFLNGATYIGWAALPGVADAAWRIVAVADFNGDGKPDVVWRNSTTGENLVWFFQGTAYAGWAALEGAPMPWWIVGVGDFNSDGQTDLLWRNLTTGENLVWYLVGTDYGGWGSLDTLADTTWVIGPDTEPDSGEQAMRAAGATSGTGPIPVDAGRTPAPLITMPPNLPPAGAMPPAVRGARRVPLPGNAHLAKSVLLSPVLAGGPMHGSSAPPAGPATTTSALTLATPTLVGPQVALPGTVVEHDHADVLGSTRVVTDQAGAVLRYHDYEPFGAEWNAPLETPKDTHLFTGKERDAETGLDYFGARYLASGVGRFTTADPEQNWKEQLVNPQLWNRYTYVRNNPLRFIDRDGRWGREVHWDLTRAIAYAAGYRIGRAESIANAVNRPDTGWTSPELVFPARRYHFSTAEERDSMFTNAIASGSLEDFGYWLHAEQDSFSHGEGWLGLLNHQFFTVDDTAWGGTDRCMSAARATYGVLSSPDMQNFELGMQPDTAAVPWEVIRPFVEKWAAAGGAAKKSIVTEMMQTADKWRKEHQ